jgi:hypothetical protein
MLEAIKKEDSSFGLMSHGLLSKLTVAIANDPDYDFADMDPTKFTIKKLLSYFKPGKDGDFFVQSSEGPFDTSPPGLVDKEYLIDAENNLYDTNFPHDQVGTFNPETGAIQA